MTQVILFHGTGGTPQHFWFPYIRKELDSKKFKVFIPQLPFTDNPNLKEQLLFVLDKYAFDSDTILVGHSAGCPLILSVLEKIEVEIKRAILVSGFVDPLDGDVDLILQPKYNWKKIKQHCQDFVFINSVNDPWGCNDQQGCKMFNKLGGSLIVRQKAGHMGSEKFNQPYKKFPLVKFLIENSL
ncbi:alpha/beta hydrolase [Candidatus Shapirobacteria bacterium]|nr:MAG: alpha/beta hydrolase [Candidatus Shapirobacteria bacterium]